MLLQNICVCIIYAATLHPLSCKGREHCNYEEDFIDCENGKIDTLEISSLKNDSMIKYVYLQNTGMSQIEYNAFINLPNLLLIDLRNNNLMYLDHRVFSTLHQLLSLFLFNNKLSGLNDNRIFASQRNLVYLNLDNNLLTNLPVEVLKPMISLDRLHVSGNPFICAQVNDTIQWCKRRSFYFKIDCKTLVDSSVPTTLEEGNNDGPSIGKDMITDPMVKQDTFHTSVFNITNKVNIIKNSDQSVNQTTVIVTAMICVVLIVICCGFGAIWLYTKRIRRTPNGFRSQQVSEIRTFQRTNTNAFRGNGRCRILEPTETPRLTLQQPLYDDVLNTVKIEQDYSSYIMIDST